MKRSNRRCGYTLIEMIAVLVLTTSLITLSTALLRRSIVGYSRTMDQAFQVQSKDRWIDRLRNDVHQANQSVISDDRLALTLKISDLESLLYFKDGETTIRQRILDGRKLAMERSPWNSVFRFTRTETSTFPLIDVELEPGCFIQARLGIAVNGSLESRELTK